MNGFPLKKKKVMAPLFIIIYKIQSKHIVTRKDSEEIMNKYILTTIVDILARVQVYAEYAFNWMLYL